MSPKCPTCGGVLAPLTIGRMPVYAETDGLRTYQTKCMACGGLTDHVRKNDFPALSATPFQTGRRWYCAPPGRARFWFVILGPGKNHTGNVTPCYKSCRIEVHAEDQRNKVPGYKSHGNVSTYSCRHIKKYAGLEYLV